jgi:hypothetical protein
MNNRFHSVKGPSHIGVFDNDIDVIGLEEIT